MDTHTSSSPRPAVPASLLWCAHVSVWVIALLSARLSRVGSQIELHITGLQGAELAPEHLRQILTAPTTEFKAISFAGAIAAVALALVLLKRSSRLLRWITLPLAVIAFAIVAIGYSH